MIHWRNLLIVALVAVFSMTGAVNAAKLVKVDEVKIEADKNVSPMDYSFGEKSFSGGVTTQSIESLLKVYQWQDEE